MSRRRPRKLDDLDDLLPNELIESTGGSTVIELKEIVNQLEEQMEEMIGSYEKRIEDLTNRLESIEDDFKQVLNALDGSGGSSPAPAAAPATSGPSTGPSTGPKGPAPPGGSGPKLG